MKKFFLTVVFLLAIVVAAVATESGFVEIYSIDLKNKISDIVVDESGMIYATTGASDSAWNGDIFKLRVSSEKIETISSLRGNGFKLWEAFNQMTTLSGHGYVLSDYYDSCGVVVSLEKMLISVPSGMECQLKNSKKSITTDGANNVFIGGGDGVSAPYVYSYSPLGSSGELTIKDSVTPGGVPEKMFFQKETNRLFLAMFDGGGIEVYDTTNPNALWRLGYPRKNFYPKVGYNFFGTAIDVIAEGQCVYALAGDQKKGTLAIILLPKENGSDWFSSANQVGEVDIPDKPIFIKKSGNKIFVATMKNIVIVDVATITSPKIVATLDIVATDLEISEGKLLVATGSFLKIIRLLEKRVVGDVNGDGKVDLNDAITSLQVIAGKNIAVDVNGSIDGKKIGLAEAVYALQKIAGLR